MLEAALTIKKKRFLIVLFPGGVVQACLPLRGLACSSSRQPAYLGLRNLHEECCAWADSS